MCVAVSCQDQAFDCRRVSNSCENGGVCGAVVEEECDCLAGFKGYDCSFADGKCMIHIYFCSFSDLKYYDYSFADFKCCLQRLRL